MTTQHTPPSRLALIVVGLLAIACIAVASAAAVVASQVHEINRDNIEVQRMAIEATAEANRVKDAADARGEMKDAHAEGVEQGALKVLIGVAVGFALVVATLAITSARLGRTTQHSTWEGR